MEKDLFRMIEIEGQCLKIKSASAVFEDAQKHYNELSVFETHNHLKDRNVLIVSARLDTVAPPPLMHLPIAEQLQKDNGGGSIKHISINTNHSFGGNRTDLAFAIGNWIGEFVG